jgi:hypothetical protein
MSAERIDAAARRLIRAAKEMLDAYGGDTPDWLQSEAMRLDAAVDEMDEALNTKEAR